MENDSYPIDLTTPTSETPSGTPPEAPQPDQPPAFRGFAPVQTPDVPDYFVWSLLETLLCCLPIGIIALIFSNKANSAKSAGQYAEAQKNAKRAKIALILGLCGAIPYFIAMFGIMLGLLLPAVQASREAARRMTCVANLKQIAVAMHNYHDMYSCFPPAYTVDSEGKPLHSWRTLLLPFIEQQALYDQIRLNEPWDSEWNSQFAEENIPFYRCPSSDTGTPPWGDCYYSVVVGEGTCYPGDKTVTLGDISDGTSNTVLVVERTTPINWMVPDEEITLEAALEGIDPIDWNEKIGSTHPLGANIAFADGSIRFIANDIAPEVWKAELLIHDKAGVSYKATMNNTTNNADIPAESEMAPPADTESDKGNIEFF